jgi:K+-sensing histidine kinase KdpD
MGDRERWHDHRSAEDAEDRVERSTLLRVEGALARRSPGFVILVGLLLLALVGVVDAVTGALDVSIFYFLPVGVVTFSRGRWMGALMSGVAAIAWTAAEIANHVTTLESSVTYWNTLTRFYAFMVVVLLVAPMRDALLAERDLAAKEKDAADQLRALNELRDTLAHAGGPEAPEMAALSELRDSLARLDGPVASA